MPKEYKEIDFNSDQAGDRAVEIMQSKKCLYDIYKETYEWMIDLRKRFLPMGGRSLEIGSGGGFLKKIAADVITSDVRAINGIDMKINAESLPFPAASLDVIYAVHTIHHVPDIGAFLSEAERALRPGGGLICVEPYWSPVAKFVYKTMHPEPFDESAETWRLQSTGPLSTSNQAMSYILLRRDWNLFRKRHASLELVYQRPFGFIRYMATGGIWLKPKLPACCFPILKVVEWLLTPFMPFLAIHHIFVLRKKPLASHPDGA